MCETGDTWHHVNIKERPPFTIKDYEYCFAGHCDRSPSVKVPKVTGHARVTMTSKAIFIMWLETVVVGGQDIETSRFLRAKSSSEPRKFYFRDSHSKTTLVQISWLT